MKLVSSFVALAIALAPLTAAAKPVHHAPKATVVAKRHTAKDKKASTASAEKGEKGEKAEKSPIVKVKATTKEHGKGKIVHHAHNVNLDGAGHKEPGGNDHHGAIVSASMKSPIATPHKAHSAKPGPKNELPKLPNPNMGKPSKGGAEKGARKAAEKKSAAPAESSDDGEQARDEELAELVARIRGLRPISAPASDNREANDPASRKGKRGASRREAPQCSKEPVEIIRGPEVERFELTRCDGSVAPLAVEQLSILIRPGGAARPTTPVSELAKKPGDDLAPRIRRVDTRLIGRIQSLADHFGKPGAPAKFFVISGYRPASVGSMHSSGRAIDFRVEGVKNEDVVAFCKTLDDTGCGYYPNSSFVHVDVRDQGAGHVSWIDASGPGESPRYVPAWPPPLPANHHLRRASATTEILPPTSSQDDKLAEEGEALLRARRPSDESTEPVDEHPADVPR